MKKVLYSIVLLSFFPFIYAQSVHLVLATDEGEKLIATLSVKHAERAVAWRMVVYEHNNQEEIYISLNSLCVNIPPAFIQTVIVPVLCDDDAWEDGKTLTVSYIEDLINNFLQSNFNNDPSIIAHINCMLMLMYIAHDLAIPYLYDTTVLCLANALHTEADIVVLVSFLDAYIRHVENRLIGYYSILMLARGTLTKKLIASAAEFYLHTNPDILVLTGNTGTISFSEALFIYSLQRQNNDILLDPKLDAFTITMRIVFDRLSPLAQQYIKKTYNCWWHKSKKRAREEDSYEDCKRRCFGSATEEMDCED